MAERDLQQTAEVELTTQRTIGESAERPKRSANNRAKRRQTNKQPRKRARTVSAFAQAYGLTPFEAMKVISKGRDLNETLAQAEGNA